MKEVVLFEYLLRHRDQLVTRTMLLDHCWDDSYDGLSNLVDVHVSRLRRKLEQAGARCTIRTVRGAGFVLEELRA
ncbi:MAG: helix-turn-helix domain-containing protein [Candidatus Binatia bacterium]